MRSTRTFRTLQFVSASLYSLGHGGNDAQKTMGIIAVLLYSQGHLGGEFHVPFWVVITCQAAMGLGTLFGGWRIVHTMGSQITRLTPVQGFCAETGGAITLFLATHLGVPVSTTHTITGAIVGVGAARRVSAVRWNVADNIVVAWVITMPAAALVGALFYGWRAVRLPRGRAAAPGSKRRDPASEPVDVGLQAGIAFLVGRDRVPVGLGRLFVATEHLVDFAGLPQDFTFGLRCRQRCRAVDQIANVLGDHFELEIRFLGLARAVEQRIAPHQPRHLGKGRGELDVPEREFLVGRDGLPERVRGVVEFAAVKQRTAEVVTDIG